MKNISARLGKKEKKRISQEKQNCAAKFLRIIFEFLKFWLQIQRIQIRIQVWIRIKSWIKSLNSNSRNSNSNSTNSNSTNSNSKSNSNSRNSNWTNSKSN